MVRFRDLDWTHKYFADSHLSNSFCTCSCSGTSPSPTRTPAPPHSLSEVRTVTARPKSDIHTRDSVVETLFTVFGGTGHGAKPGHSSTCPSCSCSPIPIPPKSKATSSDGHKQPTISQTPILRVWRQAPSWHIAVSRGNGRTGHTNESEKRVTNASEHRVQDSLRTYTNSV